MWWLILKAIVSSVVGSTFYQWFKNTKVGVWFQDKVDDFMEYLAEKYDIEMAKREEKWLSQYPNLAKRLEKLEDMAHYKCGLEEFDGYETLDKRLKKLEKDG
tara:strand:- start:237 stop:542 length:306 start_codon:yes stop_codon:yes gene_type:complete